MKYSQSLIIDDEYENSNIVSQIESTSNSGNLIILYSYIHLLLRKYTVKFIVTDTKI